MCMHLCMLSRFSRVQLCATLWTAAHQAPLSTGFSRQEYWNGLPFPSLQLLNPGKADRLLSLTIAPHPLSSMSPWLFHVSFFFKIFFSMWTIFKVFIDFVTALLLFYVLVFWPQGMWDLSSLTRDRTHAPCIER